MYSFLNPYFLKGTFSGYFPTHCVFPFRKFLIKYQIGLGVLIEQPVNFSLITGTPELIKILRKMKPWLSTFLTGALCLFIFTNLLGQKERDKEKIVFVNWENLITKRVEKNMSKWLTQGEFEPSDEYQNRISNQNRKLEKLTAEALDYYLEKYLDQLDFSTCKVSGSYDPDSETFKMYCDRIGEFIVPVPIADAPFFKENQSYLTYSSPDFVLRNNEWILSYLEIEHQGSLFKYDISQNSTYNAKDDFRVLAGDLDIHLPNSNRISNQHTDHAYENLDGDIDISKNLPKTNMNNPDAIAVIIGNRNYKRTRWVEYAENDATRVRQYLTEVLGFKSSNIFYLKNASKGDLDTYFGTTSNHKGKLFNAVKAKKSDVFVFYSGHGAPGLNDQKGYFVPIECDPNNVELGGYSLDLFYKNLAKIPAKSKTVVIDACFSGAEILDNISPIGIRVKVDTGKDLVALTSSSGAQVSTWYNAKHHGLFTYFFLKAIHDFENSDVNGDRELTFQEVFNYISNENEGLPYFARRLHGVEQTPTIQGGNSDKRLIQF